MKFFIKLNPTTVDGCFNVVVLEELPSGLYQEVEIARGLMGTRLLNYIYGVMRKYHQPLYV